MRSVTIKHQNFDESRQYFSRPCRELSIKLVFNVNIFAEYLANLAQAFLLLDIYLNLLFFVYPLALYKRSFHTLLRQGIFLPEEMLSE